MGIFFQDRERKKSSKQITVIRIILLVGVFAFLLMGLKNNFDLFYTGLAFILVGITNIINGAESHYHREKKKVYIPEYLLGVLFLTIAVTYLS
ncbi:hypothetical protein HF078_12900 [Bacillus sp. RO2]|uniref:hypothetical protein n=1 Tax=Bacillus sp. RO2 TaxID=2723913 RepID=UPI00145EEDF4|nr:hypothetical protein [Bacillus sp. RO2]NMH73983.1 hypothetical protein [Bacillus sp. RO2]